MCSTFDKISHAPHLVRRQVVHPHDVDGLELRAQVREYYENALTFFPLKV